ncbi:hypothetical protein EDI_310690 [Entamoeba dispar SAW760]|uniref:Transmembrane protein n=1 Tax=Entamoeba dispar (strain ATCC PRA-260 / SAW760) TaxID=370354 RepID=B0E8H3_ENTDS|nr:uncharacterized protein EDI_310690 [Entamoeba dispar SAW760]EDR29175.1 hypothetical protein EDI_310690 [Entamoeba dispar SAW760]|eukprot:EDR29175.1 hypothetical protein EDI_310690 [Entamoeba dispar SAW760]
MSSQPVYTQPQYVAYPSMDQYEQQQYEVPLVPQSLYVQQMLPVQENKKSEKHPIIGLFFFLGFIFPLIWLVQIIIYAFKSNLHVKVWGLRALCAFLFYCLLTLVGFLILFGINLNQCYEHRYH